MAYEKPSLKPYGKASRSLPGAPNWPDPREDRLTGVPMFRTAGLNTRSPWKNWLSSLKASDFGILILGVLLLCIAPLSETWLFSPGGSGPENPEGEGLFSNTQRTPINPDTEEGPVTPLTGRDSVALVTDRRLTPPPVSPENPLANRQKEVADRWRDVLSAARNGATQATRTAAFPAPVSKLKSALSGLGNTSSGAASQAQSAPRLDSPSSAKLFSAPRVTQSLSRTQPPPNYKGVAARGLDNPLGSRGLENEAFHAGGFFDRGEKIGALHGPSAEGDISGGKASSANASSGVQRGSGDSNVATDTKVSTTKDEKKIGESLLAMKLKIELQKAEDLKWAKKTYAELGRQQMIEGVAAQAGFQMMSQMTLMLMGGMMGLPYRAPTPGQGGAMGGGGLFGFVPIGGGAGAADSAPGH